MAVRFYEARGLVEGQDHSGVKVAFFETNYLVNEELLSTVAKCEINLK